jgi:diadenosine tetraphosphate (Ap4A) HIT family hydrolase
MPFPRRALLLGAGLLATRALRADVTRCACDPKNPESLKARECSLCNEAEKQPADVEFFLLKDINPRKPMRWLVLPRRHDEAEHAFHKMPRDERVRLWKFAVQAAREKFGNDWGLAYNGVQVRTQCHLHIHVGRFIRAAENSKFRLVKRIEEFPAPEADGVFIHPVAGGYHVHYGEQIMETALVR